MHQKGIGSILTPVASKSVPGLLLQQLMASDEVGCAEAGAGVQDEVQRQLVAVVDAERQVLKLREDNVLDVLTKHIF